MRWALARTSIAVCLTALLAADARAQKPPDAAGDAPRVASPADKQESARLFELGKSQLEGNDFANACPNLARSDVLDPGVATLGLLAACHERAGQLALAQREYLETAKRAHIASDRREAYALERAASLKVRVPVLVVRAPDGDTSLEVTVGADRVQLGQELPLDPGRHVVTVRRPGKKPWSASVTLVEKDRREIAIPALEDEPVGGAVAPSASAKGEASPAVSSGSDARVVGFALLGLGAAGLGVAAVTGVMVLDRKSTVEQDCPSSRCSTPEGYDAASSGQTLLVVNTIGFGVGVAAAAVGTVLLLTSASSKPRQRTSSGTAKAAVTATVGPNRAAIGWRHPF